LKEHQERHVIKPQGKNVESHHLIIGDNKDGSDAISRVELLIEQGLQVEGVEVEQYRGGVEAGLSVWLNGSDKIGPVNLNFEHKRSNDKEIGYLTPEMGTLMRYLEDEENPFYQETLGKLLPVFRAANYRGQVDLGFKVTKEGYFGTEFTTRIGKPAWALEDELHITPWSDLAYACATGKALDLKVRYDWAVGVVLVAFGFPFEDKAENISKGLVVEGVDENNLEHVHPWQMRLNKKGQFVVGHGAGIVLVTTGRGESINSAKSRAYNVMDRLSLPNGFYRHDISDKISQYELDELKIMPLEEASV
jgi:phosphoribosylamine--glycine ligase